MRKLFFSAVVTAAIFSQSITMPLAARRTDADMGAKRTYLSSSYGVDDDPSIGAEDLKPNKTAYGTVSATSHGHYRITLSKDSTVKIKTAQGKKKKGEEIGSWDIDIVDMNANRYCLGSGISRSKTISANLSAGTYYIDVYSGGNASYRISYKTSSLTMKKPTIKSVRTSKLLLGNSLDGVRISGYSQKYGYKMLISATRDMAVPLYHQDDLSVRSGGSIDISGYILGEGPMYVTVQPFTTDIFGYRIYGKASTAKKFLN